MLLLYFPSQSMKDFNLMWSGTLLTSGFVGSGRWGAGGLIPSGTGGQEGNTVLARWCSPSWHFLDVEGSSVQQINNILGQPALQHWMISHTFIILMLFFPAILAHLLCTVQSLLSQMTAARWIIFQFYLTLHWHTVMLGCRQHPGEHCPFQPRCRQHSSVWLQARIFCVKC